LEIYRIQIWVKMDVIGDKKLILLRADILNYVTTPGLRQMQFR
jgi:hypothetical protein